MIVVSPAEAEKIAPSLGQTPERWPGFSWSLPNLEAFTDGASLCVHRGARHAHDWVRDVWIATADRWLPVARRASAHLFTAGARQLRWYVRSPIDPRHEAVWSRYGARPIALANDVLTVALDDPSLPRSVVHPWAGTVFVGGGISLGPTRYGELAHIATLFQEPHVHQALGYWRGATVDELLARFVPRDASHHAREPMQLYTVRKRGAAVGVLLEHARTYDEDTVREIDLVLDDGAVPLRTWAQLLATVADVSFKRGATRMVVNVREGFPNMAQLFGADEASKWSVDHSTSRRTYYTATPAQFYASPAARMFKRHQTIV